MPVDVFAADEQRDRPVDLERWITLARPVLADRGVKGDAEVSLLFVDEAAIAALNERFLGRRRPDRRAGLPHRGRAGARRPLAGLRGHRPGLANRPTSR